MTFILCFINKASMGDNLDQLLQETYDRKDYLIKKRIHINEQLEELDNERQMLIKKKATEVRKQHVYVFQLRFHQLRCNHTVLTQEEATSTVLRNINSMLTVEPSQICMLKSEQVDDRILASIGLPRSPKTLPLNYELVVIGADVKSAVG